MSLLETIIPLLSKSTQRLDFSVAGTGDGVCMRITPIVGKVREDATEQERKLYGALSVPLKLEGRLEEIEAAVVERVRDYLSYRNEWQAKLASIHADLGESVASDNTESTEHSVESNDGLEL
ncbi:MAG: hypothetical protein C9356_14985 [Oleiphilus sp.]|nr:MAG: hypothetical protein C9356_14985 [Oleiphilus sp.]